MARDYFTARHLLYRPDAASEGDTARLQELITMVTTINARIAFFII